MASDAFTGNWNNWLGGVCHWEVQFMISVAIGLPGVCNGNTNLKELKYEMKTTIDYRERITIDPRIRSVKPCIRGTRITVSDTFDYLGGGMSVEEILDDFPDLTLDDIRACFAFAADRERRLSVVRHETAL